MPLLFVGFENSEHEYIFRSYRSGMKVMKKRSESEDRCFNFHFGSRGAKIDSVILEDGTIYSGFTVISVGPHFSYIILDYIEDLSYQGVLGRVTQLSAMLEGSNNQRDSQERELDILRESLRSQKRTPMNEWLRGSFADCSVCLEKTHSRLTCGHHLCGHCFTGMINHAAPGSSISCPECRKKIDRKGVSLYGDELAEHCKSTADKFRALRKTVEGKDAIIESLQMEIARLRSRSSNSCTPLFNSLFG